MGLLEDDFDICTTLTGFGDVLTMLLLPETGSPDSSRS